MTSPQALAQATLTAVRSVLDPDGPIALHEPELGGNAETYVAECVRSGWVSSVGAFVNRFEGMVCDHTGSPHAFACVNGTAALHLALLAAGVEPDDEVIVPALTFVATANAVHYCGAVPHVADIEAATLGLDPEKLDAHLRDILLERHRPALNRLSGRRVRAVVVMHCFGHPSNMEGLAEVCRRHGLVLVEDGAESVGSTYDDRHCGTFGQVAALSFNGNKIVTTGGGGAVLTADPERAARVRHLGATAKRPHPWAYDHDAVGFNYRMPNLNAALGCAQIEELPRFVAQKRALAARYAQAFAGTKGIAFVTEPPRARSNYWLNAVLLPDDGESRDATLAALNEAGIAARPAWAPIHLLAPYAEAPRMEDLSVAEGIARTLVNLPSSARLGQGRP